MKLVCRSAVAAAVAVMFCEVLAAQNAANPIQVALLRWYQANTAITFSSTCASTATGSAAFDGRHIWVTCYQSNEVQEFNSSDGSVVATLTGVASSGLTLGGMIYDGENIWVSANSSSAGSVIKINAATVNASGGTMECSPSVGCSTITVGASAAGLAFDGTYVWVANSAASASNLSAIKANGTTANSVSLPSTSPTCSEPTGMFFDGVHIWVGCLGSNTVQAVTPNDGITPSLTQYATINGVSSGGFVFDGTYIWIGETSGATSLINTTATPPLSVITPTFSPSTSGAGPCAFDGKYVWMTDYSSGQVYKVNASALSKSLSGSPSISVLGPYTGPTKVNSCAFDGGNIWMATGASPWLSKF